MTKIRMTWVSKDGQGQMDCGEHDADVDREAEEAAALHDLIAAGTSDDEPGLRAGRFVWEVQS